MTVVNPNISNNQNTSINLNLEEEQSDHCRFLTIHAHHIMALGGEDGVITAFPMNKNNSQSHVIKQYDDVVKALAFSDDGKRVAVGYDDGNVDIYAYSDEELMPNKDNNGSSSNRYGFHPFICGIKEANANDGDDNGDQDNDAFFTQSSQADDYHESITKTQPPTFRLKHRFEGSVRHLQFQPLKQSEDVESHGKNKTSIKYYLAIAAESSPGFMIVDVTTQNSSSSCKYLDDEAKMAHREGGVRSVSFSPNDGQIIATLGMDGRMAYWSTKGDDPILDWELMHSDSHKIVNKADMGEFSAVADRSLYPVWSTCGTILGIPGSPELKFRKLKDGDDSWFKSNRMILNMSSAQKNNDDDDSNCIVGMAFDPKNEGYVVTSSRDGIVSLWKINKERKGTEPEGQFIKVLVHNESLCTHILWYQDSQSKEECVFLALQNGTMLTIKGREAFIPKEVATSEMVSPAENEKNTKPKVSKDGEMSDDDNEGLDTQPLEDKEAHVQSQQKKSYDDYDMDDYMNNDNDDDDFDNSLKANKSKFVADEAEENINNYDDDESQFDDVIVPKNTQETEQLTRSDALTSATDKVEENHGMARRENDGIDMEQDYFGAPGVNLEVDDAASVRSIVHPQDAFAPSATPNGPRTILCWNHIGVITSHNEWGTSIDIDFNDVMANRPIKFRDNMQFIMGSLGDEGAIFASDLLDDVDDEIDDNVIDALDGLNGMSEATKKVVKRSERRNGKSRAKGSCVYFYRFNTFGSLKNKDWFVTLHEGERVISCATGIGWNAVATNRRFLRSFTSGGVQGPLVWLRGEPVSMVGRGHFLAVFYHESNPSEDNTQRLGYSLYDGRNMREISTGSVAAISPGSFLTWVGFSNDFALSVMDSNGILSMLLSRKPEGSGDVTSFSWVPMLDTFGLKKSREDKFWPVCVQNGKLICVPLKGVQHPNPARRPLTTSLQLRMPLARGGNDKTHGIEEVSVRADLALNHKHYLNDFMVNNCGENEEDLENEYAEMCNQVDKITLRLFHGMIGAGKVESALDLARRLYNEESFDAAITIAERSNQRKLGDHIYAIKEERFEPFAEDQHSDVDAESYSNGSVDTFTKERDVQEAVMKVSPETSISRNKRKLQVENSERPQWRKRANPFATNIKKSPGKSPPPKSLHKKPTLSRMSTFSSQSRQLNRASKEIL